MAGEQGGTNVGSLFYEVGLDTRRLMDDARGVDKATRQAAEGMERAGAAAGKASGRFYDAAGRLREANGQFVATGSAAGQAATAVDRAAMSFNVITRAVQLYVAALTLVKSAQAADDVRMLGARLEIAAGSAEKGAAALAELQRIAARTQTELAGNVQVFARLNSSILQMGGTQRDTLRITELLTMAIRVSGASAAEASSAMTQFAQAMGSGRLQGDELRSLLENAPYLMQQLADGIGVPIGALRQLGEDGKLTSDVVASALSKAAAKIQADFAKVPQTLSGAMTGAADAARRANEALDTLTGTSAALTGATKGLGSVLDMLAMQFSAATSESDRLGRNDKVKSWADSTATILSYVADAADFVTRGFRQAGTAIGGLAAAAGMAARGELAQALETLARMRKDVLAIGDAQYAGARMRQMMAALASGTDGSDAMDRRAAGGAPSPLKGGGGGGGDKSKFDALAYLAKLRQDTATAYDEIGLIEEEALRKNQQLLAQGKISAAQAAEARTLIETAAAQKRRELLLNEAEERRALIERQGREELAVEQRLAEERARGRKLAEDTIAGGDPIQALIMEQERRAQVLRDYAMKDQEAARTYAEALVTLETETQQRITALRKQAADAQLAEQQKAAGALGSIFGSLATIAEESEGRQSSAYRAMFAAQKAFAIASAIVNIQKGISDAAATGATWADKLAGMAAVASATASIVSTIKGTQYGGGRQYGGGTDAGSLYRVNETGRPEMFTAANGAQYMLPNTRGEVTPADQVAGGGLQVIVQNYAGAEIDVQQRDDGRIVEIAVRRAKAELTNEVQTNTGPFFGALRGATNVRGAL